MKTDAYAQLRGTDLETKLLKKISSKLAHVKAEILFPWLNKLRFETGIFERVLAST